MFVLGCFRRSDFAGLWVASEYLTYRLAKDYAGSDITVTKIKIQAHQTVIYS